MSTHVADIGALPGLSPTTLSGWGGGPETPVWEWTPDDSEALAAALNAGTTRQRIPAIARGCGRSYGDAAVCTGGLVVRTDRLRSVELDPQQGVLTVGAGVSLGEILARCAPEGWTLPVVPGTQHVSVGGAIASDVHGKNHASAGSFGRHVEALGLLTSSGSAVELSATTDDPLFHATVGGLGLTGVITWARIRLARLCSPELAVDTDRVDDLDAALSVLSSPGGSHRVAWLDLMRPNRVRAIVTRADHATEGVDSDRSGWASRMTRQTPVVVPPRWPSWPLQPAVLAGYNALRLRLSPRSERGRTESFAEHMFPLDTLGHWPRLYGTAGLVQYQFVVPAERSEALHRVIEAFWRARIPIYLAVLKDMGLAGPAPLGFPMRGWTLALDAPRRTPGLDRVLDRCDSIVIEAGGRVYLTKDSRLGAAATAEMYPELASWRATRDEADPSGRWCSDLALRTGLAG